MKTIIHVHQPRIRHNTKHGTCDPPLIARTYKGVSYGQNIKIRDQEGNVVCELRYRPTQPLSCGARVWLETNLEVEVS